ncbi:MAG: hypothetical protein JXP73_20390 [Deltaproteobacteria bacterium]|jgi:hypothetical protein|nr:hypothetical protein [Deltaproteobacteria bacterium]
MSRRLFTVNVAAAALGLSLGPPAANASLVRALDLAELVRSADQVVVAEVVSVRAAWDSAHRNIYTTVEIAVQESWKGTPPGNGRVRIRQPGGVVGDIEMTVHGMPRFSVGERALLFLRHSHVCGMAQGKRRLRWETFSRRWVVEGAERSATVTIDARGKLQAARPNRTEDLNSLRDRVRGLVGE